MIVKGDVCMTQYVSRVLGLEIDSTPKVGYLSLCMRANERGETSVSYKQLLKYTNVGSRSTISRAIKALEAANLIIKERSTDDVGSIGSNLYTICDWKGIS
jgi:DNA-binding transcriptional ArsR family regulator